MMGERPVPPRRPATPSPVPWKVMPTPTPATARPAAPARTRRALATLAATLVALLLAVLGAAPASAHNTLRGSDPADGATVPTAPDAITLTFDQHALELGTEVVVTAEDGTTVNEGPVQLGDVTVVQPLAAERPAGAYVVSWRVTSADGHPLTGTLRFVASEAVTAGGAAAPGDAPADGAADPTADATPTDDATPTPTDDATPSPTATADATDPSDDVTAAPISAPADQGTPAWVWIVVAVVVLAALAGTGAALAARRRAQAARTDGTPGTTPGTGTGAGDGTPPPA